MSKIKTAKITAQEKQAMAFVKKLGFDHAAVDTTANGEVIQVDLMCTSTAQVTKALKQAGAKIVKGIPNNVAEFDFGGSIEFGKSYSNIIDGVYGIVFEFCFDEDRFYSYEISQALKKKGFDLSTQDIESWFSGEGSGNMNKADRLIKKFLGEHSYDYGNKTARMEGVLTYRLGLSKERRIGGMRVDYTEAQHEAAYKKWVKQGYY